MNIEEIKSYLETNKDNEDVVGLINSYKTPLTRESVEEWTKDGDGRSWIDRTCDVYSQKAITTARENAIAKFKEEELPKLIQDAIKSKSNEGKSEVEIKLEEALAKIEANEKEMARRDLQNKFTKTLSEKNLPVDLIDFILNSDDENVIGENITKFEGIMSGLVDTRVKERLGSGYVPPKLNNNNTQFTMDDVKNMSPDDINKYWDQIKDIK